MPYAVDFVPSAAKELAKLSAKERQRVAAKIDALACELATTASCTKCGIARS
jgi:mRNA-degrading endonuclease RelE of RelBE toxin-antitoxin system